MYLFDFLHRKIVHNIIYTTSLLPNVLRYLGKPFISRILTLLCKSTICVSLKDSSITKMNTSNDLKAMNMNINVINLHTLHGYKLRYIPLITIETFASVYAMVVAI